MSNESVKRFKKGEFLFREGEETESVFFIQSGRVSINIERSGNKFEFDVLSNSNFAGEQSILGNKRQNFNAVALTEVNVLELPASNISKQLESSSPSVKLVFKSMTAEIKRMRGIIRSNAGDQDPNPCPQKLIPRLFSILYLVIKNSAQEKPDEGLFLSWSVLKIYTTRMFLESNSRMEKVLMLLSKLNYLELNYTENDEGEKELYDIRISEDISFLEQFSEFYQYNFFKPGKSEIIYVDQMAFQILRGFVEQAQDAEPDWKGLVHFDYGEFITAIKEKFNLDVKVLHLNLLEKKGLFVKRTSKDEGSVDFSYEKEEFERVYRFWKIIREIDRWNETGTVDVTEDLDKEEEVALAACPKCNNDFKDDDRFCSACGFKLVA